MDNSTTVWHVYSLFKDFKYSSLRFFFLSSFGFLEIAYPLNIRTIDSIPTRAHRPRDETINQMQLPQSLIPSSICFLITRILGSIRISTHQPRVTCRLIHASNGSQLLFPAHPVLPAPKFDSKSLLPARSLSAPPEAW